MQLHGRDHAILLLGEGCGIIRRLCCHMGKLINFLIFHYAFLMLMSSMSFSFAADTLSSDQSIRDGETLVSSDQTFELGFFSPEKSKNRYLGLWYTTTPDIVVWVANRNTPLTDSSGSFTVSNEGHLVLFDGSNTAIWSSNLSVTTTNAVAQLLETGNLVVRSNSTDNSDAYLWQSFDYPTDTLLPEVNFGWDLETGMQKYLTSWKSVDDPTPGDYVYKINIVGLPQVEAIKTGPTPVLKYRSGLWNGLRFSGTPMGDITAFKSIMVYNQMKIYFRYEPLDKKYITRLTLKDSGVGQLFVSKRGSSIWNTMYSIPNDACDNYGRCGPNGFCMINGSPICQCLPGYTPKLPDDWGLLNWSSGCNRKVMSCSTEEGVLKISGVKLPNLLEFEIDQNISLEDCKVKCLKNCSCSAYANSNITGGGSGCIMWFGELIDIRQSQDVDSIEALYVRVPASEIDTSSRMRDEEKRKRMIIIPVVLAICGLILLAITIRCVRSWKRKPRSSGLGSRKDDIDLPLFDLATISSATDNFSSDNVIGAGGFGPVYKGSLTTGKKIAVKRLSNSTGQGLKEFMNEVLLIAKLQHRNLVGILGCCIEKEERMLVYEYMPNKSLDQFIFGHDRRTLLGWKTRFNIAIGIARGLLYLHQDSKLQIIHRDLKTSNILLDGNLNPKISDFGLARIFEGEEEEAKTKRVIGTYGYMSPEYAFDGKFSVKSDVYGFGVLLLELVSGKRNRGFCDPNHHHNLLGHAWLLWAEDKALELVDQALEDSLDQSQVKRCIHVGLLCVQKFPEDRPTMSYVVSMLITEGAIPFRPKEPGFFMERSTGTPNASSTGEVCSDNIVTITMPIGR